MLHERIKVERIKKGLSQRELGDHFNVTQQAIGSWETGKAIPDAITLSKLADFFVVTTDYLLGRTNKPKEVKKETITVHPNDDPMSDLPPEALERIEEFKELMRLKYNKKPT